MIQANELRIGDEIDRGAVVEIHKDGVKVFNGLHYYENEIFPIPLSPEILEKCGFSKTSYEEQSWQISQSENGIVFCEDDKNGYCEVVLDFYSQVRVRYLHQLQNLYYALTGTELNINL